LALGVPDEDACGLPQRDSSTGVAASRRSGQGRPRDAKDQRSRERDCSAGEAGRQQGRTVMGGKGMGIYAYTEYDFHLMNNTEVSHFANAIMSNASSR
jgi:hypothetical protein